MGYEDDNGSPAHKIELERWVAGNLVPSQGGATMLGVPSSDGTFADETRTSAITFPQQLLLLLEKRTKEAQQQAEKRAQEVAEAGTQPLLTLEPLPIRAIDASIFGESFEIPAVARTDTSPASKPQSAHSVSGDRDRDEGEETSFALPAEQLHSRAHTLRTRQAPAVAGWSGSVKSSEDSERIL